MSLGMNWGMSQSRLDGITDDDTMHLFQSPCQPGRLPWLTNYKTHKHLACFQRLQLLRGSAFHVTRVNLHVHFILRVWMCRSLRLIILYILKNSAMFNARLNPVRPEEIGEKIVVLYFQCSAVIIKDKTQSPNCGDDCYKSSFCHAVV